MLCIWKGKKKEKKIPTLSRLPSNADWFKTPFTKKRENRAYIQVEQDWLWNSGQRKDDGSSKFEHYCLGPLTYRKPELFLFVASFLKGGKDSLKGRVCP